MAAELVGDYPVAAAHALRFVRFCRRSGVRIMLTCGIRGAARLSATAGTRRSRCGCGEAPSSIEAVTGMRLHAPHGHDWTAHYASSAPIPSDPTPPACSPKEHPGRYPKSPEQLKKHSSHSRRTTTKLNRTACKWPARETF